MLRLLDSAVDGIRASGHELILDLHKCPGHDFLDGTIRDQAFFVDAGHRRDWLRIWDQLAERYGDRPGIMLELLNEPVAPSAEMWNKVKDELAAAVRRMAPKAKLRPSDRTSGMTPRSSRSWSPSTMTTRSAAFTSTTQTYSRITSTMVRRRAFKERRTYPGNYTLTDDSASRLPSTRRPLDRDRLTRFLAPVFRFRDRHSARIACTEFGVYMGGPNRESRHA